MLSVDNSERKSKRANIASLLQWNPGQVEAVPEDDLIKSYRGEPKEGSDLWKAKSAPNQSLIWYYNEKNKRLAIV